MSKRVISIVIVLLFSCSAFPNNPWTGSASLDYGSNFKYLGEEGRLWESSKYGVSASARYRHRVFFLEAGGNIGSTSKLDNLLGFTARADTSFDFSITAKSSGKLRGGTYLRGGWNISRSDELRIDYSFNYEHDVLGNATLAATAKGEILNTAVSSSEEADNSKLIHNASLNYIHRFHKTGREFSLRYDILGSDNRKYSYWEKKSYDGKGDPEATVTNKYRITPEMIDASHQLKLSYSENTLGNVDGLDADFSLIARLKTDLDYQRAATLVGNAWRDSTQYHEDFLFDAYTLSPVAHVRFTRKKYKLDLSYTPEYYTTSLSDESHPGSYGKGIFSHLVNFKGDAFFSKNHKLSLKYDRSVKKPDYLQVCWFERAGSQYSNVSYIGNPYLLPEVKDLLDFSYVFSIGHFSATAALEYEYKFRTIEQTYKEIEDESGKRRVYTWLNGGYSNTNSASAAFAWDGGNLQAMLKGKLKYFHGVTNTGNVKTSSEYSINGDVSYRLKTWTFVCRGKYDSKINRLYTSVNERVKLDCRVDKQFGRFNIFLEALDILEKPVEIVTWNADQTMYRYEQQDKANRLFHIGATLKF